MFLNTKLISVEPEETAYIARPAFPKDSDSKTSGFSLLELIIVLLIISILCVLAIPQVTATLQANRLNTLNAALAGKLSEARIQAIKRNTPVSMLINTQSRRFWVEAGGNIIGPSESYPSEIQLEFAPNSATVVETITFNSFGNLQTAPKTINEVNSRIRVRKSLQVSLSGKLTVQPTIRF